MSGIAHATVRSLAGPSIKRSSYTAAAAAADAASRSDFSSYWRRRSSPPSLTTSTAAFSSSPPSVVLLHNNDDSTTSNKHRQRALSLYRQLLRGAERMPTPNRQNYIKRKTRQEFQKHKTLTDTEEIDFQLRLADTNLDTVLVQAEHLSRLFGDPEYQNYN